VKSSAGRYRWIIVALIFFATTINYLDRQVISLLKDDYLEKEFGWTEIDYSNIVIAFQLAYAIGMLIAGWFVDRIGTKMGYSISLFVWSIAAMIHALAKSTLGFMGARALLGISEAGNFPAAIKTVAEWFPKKERALATGIFNSGTNIGAVFAPLTVPLIAVSYGWQMAFILTGVIGFVWLFFWFRYYEIPSRQKRLSAGELNFIQSDERPDETGKQTEKVGWLQLLGFRQTWAFFVGKFLTDPVWWFYLFWLPTFLNKQYGMSKTELALPVAIVYIIAAFGSIFGGWLSGFFIMKGWTAFKARKTSMFLFALFALPVILALRLGNISYWFPIVIIGIAAAAHQAWSANIYTTVSDIFPKKAVASVTGIGGMAGAVGGILIAYLAGKLLDHFKRLGHIETGYYVMFIVCGCAYLIAWLSMHILTPRNSRVEI
jgi:MFS transporter, ACS family, hexuronate transporter